MDVSRIDQLLRPFFTTKEGGKGTCLELSMVRDVVKQDAGFIDTGFLDRLIMDFGLLTEGHRGTN